MENSKRKNQVGVKVKIEVDSKELDLAIEKTQKLKATLEEVEQLIASHGNGNLTVVNNYAK